MMLAEVEEPLFHSVESALAFAFSEQYVDMPRSAASRMACTPGKTGNGLGGLDGFAQAGMILSSIGSLSDLHRSILTARFSPPLGFCNCGAPCCRGFRHNLRWMEAVTWLSDFVGTQIHTVMPYRRLREGIVRKHFGDKIRLGEVADFSGVHRNTASNHASRILQILRTHEKQARFEARAILEASGLVNH